MCEPFQRAMLLALRTTSLTLPSEIESTLSAGEPSITSTLPSSKTAILYGLRLPPSCPKAIAGCAALVTSAGAIGYQRKKQKPPSSAKQLGGFPFGQVSDTATRF